MDILVENRYTASYDMMQEVARKYVIGPRPWTFWLTPLYVIGWFILWERPTAQSLCVAIIILQVLLPDLYTVLSLRSSKKNHDGVLPETRVVFGADIQMFDGMVHLTIPYDKIRKVVRLKHCIFLMNGKRTGIILDPAGFTTGSWEELRELLREKCPGIHMDD